MKTFVFDLYNTLIDIRTDEHREQSWAPIVDFFAERGIKTDWQTLCALYDECWKKHLDELYESSEYAYPEGDILCVYKGIAKSLGGELDDETATECAVKARFASIVHLRLFDGIKELFEKLKTRGAKLYLLSNAQASFTYKEIEECGLSGAFDGFLLSSECGCRKPDPKYFGMLFDKYGLDKRDAVMVGDDTVSDGMGAADFGIMYVKADGGAAAHAAELIALADRK
ncbi:MAG: HAD family hydrolase [Clostridiales bacterium]|nr:HAD family hydrolase [Clostridiales bacterium]